MNKSSSPSPMPHVSGVAASSSGGLARSAGHPNTIAETNAKLRSKILRGEAERTLTPEEMQALHTNMMTLDPAAPAVPKKGG